MSWTVKLIKKNLINGTLTVVVEYSDGKEVITETYTSTDPNFDIKKKLIKRIDELTKIDTTFKALKTGDIDTTVVIPEPEVPVKPLPPTAEEIAMNEYQSKKMELVSLKADLDLGLITQEDYDKLLNETKLLLEATKG